MNANSAPQRSYQTVSRGKIVMRINNLNNKIYEYLSREWTNCGSNRLL